MRPNNTKPPEKGIDAVGTEAAYKVLRDAIRLLITGFGRPASEVQSQFHTILREEVEYAKPTR